MPRRSRELLASKTNSRSSSVSESPRKAGGGKVSGGATSSNTVTATSTAPSTPASESADPFTNQSNKKREPMSEQDLQAKRERDRVNAENMQKLLAASAVYSGNIAAQRAELEQQQQQQQLEQSKSSAKSSKRKSIPSAKQLKSKKQKMQDEIPYQSKLITGSLKDYQLDGVRWLVSLYELGTEGGILAEYVHDTLIEHVMLTSTSSEMGLGKTLQTIAFLAHLRERGSYGPFMVVVPLSVLDNWINEIERFAPSIPAIAYHGTPQEREELRYERLGLRRSKNSRGALKTIPPEEFPIIVTTYDILIRDRNYLTDIREYKAIIVDESHRLKNMNCRLMLEIKKLSSSFRLLLTGTPLHNNIRELWSLLAYISPAVFPDWEVFEELFDFSEVTEEVAPDDVAKVQAGKVAEQLQNILRPFMLRRVKRDVEQDLPLKKEYVITAPMTRLQKDHYDAVMQKDIRQFLIGKHTGGDSSSSGSTKKRAKNASAEVEQEPARGRGKRRKLSSANRRTYREQSDEEFFDAADRGLLPEQQRPSATEEMSAAEIGRAHAEKMAKSKVNNLKLQNAVMQLRKVANHPFLFDWPIDSSTGQEVVNDDLLNASGKMMLLDQLLESLFAQDHKVLLFSQFTTMLDVIHAWANERNGWSVYRIDGRTTKDDRLEQMKAFNSDNSKDSCRLFLLSTRSGGVGITLTGASTVILFDSDWNPQQDLQAMARAHRIGQTKPVLIFRFVTQGTIEGKILQRASSKRKLEALVMGDGAFKGDRRDLDAALGGSRRKEATMVELAEEILATQARSGTDVKLAKPGQKILGAKQLEAILDRSDEAMQRKEADTEGVEVMETEASAANNVLDALFEDGDDEADRTSE